MRIRSDDLTWTCLSWILTIPGGDDVFKYRKINPDDPDILSYKSVAIVNHQIVAALGVDKAIVGVAAVYFLSIRFVPGYP